MIYKDKVQSLLETFNIKLALIESVAEGRRNLPAEDVKRIINDLKSISERIENLIVNER
jgi:hypothetical protein